MEELLSPILTSAALLVSILTRLKLMSYAQALMASVL